MPDTPSLDQQLQSIRDDVLACRERLAALSFPSSSRLLAADLAAAGHALSTAALQLSNARVIGTRGRAAGGELWQDGSAGSRGTTGSGQDR